ncbi:hypothetical protein OZZ08_11890 [Malaciobacter mytili]|uniref:hypothetical protein n=1 Tax=Malaciobacter mytili TaxID=603050 RepID=UPI003BB1214B
MDKKEIINRLKNIGINKPNELLKIYNGSKRTVEKWFLPNGNFPSWFEHYLKLLEENKKLKLKIELLKLEKETIE